MNHPKNNGSTVYECFGIFDDGTSQKSIIIADNFDTAKEKFLNLFEGDNQPTLIKVRAFESSANQIITTYKNDYGTYLQGHKEIPCPFTPSPFPFKFPSTPVTV